MSHADILRTQIRIMFIFDRSGSGVKSDANPFDLHWRVYFETRKRFR